MATREERNYLEDKVQVDDAYLGGERTGGKVGRGSENKVAFIAAVFLTEDDRPLQVRLTPVPGFTLKTISAWEKDRLAPGSAVFSDGLLRSGGRSRLRSPNYGDHRTQAKRVRVPVDQHRPRQSPDQYVGLPSCLRLLKVCRLLSRGLLLPLQSVFRFAHAPAAPADRRRFVRSSVPAPNSSV